MMAESQAGEAGLGDDPSENIEIPDAFELQWRDNAELREKVRKLRAQVLRLKKQLANLHLKKKILSSLMNVINLIVVKLFLANTI